MRVSAPPGVSGSPGAPPGVSSSPGVSATPGVSGSPGVSATPGVSDSPRVSATPGVSAAPGVSSSPGVSAPTGVSDSPGVSDPPTGVSYHRPDSPASVKGKDASRTSDPALKGVSKDLLERVCPYDLQISFVDYIYIIVLSPATPLNIEHGSKRLFWGRMLDHQSDLAT